ncbi:Cytochrome P450 monooxygenase rdc4 [Lasiodiplodia theobromae]|uniref:Cytochrome P450 monooxygenase rdc4 n=1 Tax=Lasiodiplodia theobromae TaxID=45133 RepID=A0A5N5D536_9PEZI|nr:Cytochrome P450 monooxygenase rdc4 [Lasiodiplodia theobromae]
MEAKLVPLLQEFLFNGDARLSNLRVTHVSLALFILWLVTSTTFALYNLLLHPLAKYPGPRLAGCTSLVYLYHFLAGTSVSWVAAQHRRYGAVVRLAPDRLSYTKAEAWKDIFGHRTGGHRANPKDARTQSGAIDGYHSLVTEPDDERHGQTRRVFSHAFSDRALVQQEGLIQGYVGELVELIRRGGGGGVAGEKGKTKEMDAVKLFNFATFDIMADLAFGDPLGNLKEATYAPWVDAMFGCFKNLQIISALNEYRIAQIIYAVFLMPRTVRAAAELTISQCADLVARRMDKGKTERPDIWGLMMRAEERVQFTRGEMTSQSFLFMIAGTETTATLLSGLTWFLMMNPTKYKKLAEEIRAVESEEELESDRNLRKLKYLNACLEEGLRLYPPVPLGTNRKVARGGNTICGDWLPEDTRLTVDHYSAYRSAENFKDPDVFLPERWIPGEPGFEEHHAYDKREVLQPFSYGPRNCLGKNLAYYEMRALYAKVLWNFDLELCAGMETWIDQKTWALWHKPPLMVRFTPRVQT